MTVSDANPFFQEFEVRAYGRASASSFQTFMLTPYFLNPCCCYWLL